MLHFAARHLTSRSEWYSSCYVQLAADCQTEVASVSPALRLTAWILNDYRCGCFWSGAEAELNNKPINLKEVLPRQQQCYYFFIFKVREQTIYPKYYILECNSSCFICITITFLFVEETCGIIFSHDELKNIVKNT